MAHQPLPGEPAREYAVPCSTLASSNPWGDAHTAESVLGSASAHFQKLLTEVADLARILTRATGSAIALRGEHGTLCRATSGEGVPPIGAPVDTGICKQCLDSGEPLCCDDVEADRRVNRKSSEAIGIRAIAVVPIYAAGGVAGIIAAFSTTSCSFHHQHLATLQQLASAIGSAAEIPDELQVAGFNSDEPSDADAGISWLQFLIAAQSDTDHWNEVFVESPLPWRRFLESVCLHLVVVGLVLALPRTLPTNRLVFANPLREAQITYYPVSRSFPARGSRPATQPEDPKHFSQSTRGIGQHPERIVVAASHGRIGTAPAPSTAAAPSMPASAVRDWRNVAIGAQAGTLPAPPTAGSLHGRRDLPNAAVVAPSPDVAGGPRLMAMSAPNASVVPPSPNLGGLRAMNRPRSAGQVGSGEGLADGAVVPPPPSINEHPALSYGQPGTGVRGGVQVVGPPPSLGNGNGFGTSRSPVALSGVGSEIVAPAPSIEGSAIGKRGTGMGSGVGTALQVVPPPPSIGAQDASGAGGVGGTAGRGAGRSLATLGGSGIVPPPPSLQGGAAGGISSRGRGNGLSGDGSGVVGPPPSLQGGAGGISARGRGNGLAGEGSGVVGPPPSLGGTGNSVGGDRGGLLARGNGAGGGLPPASAADGSGAPGAGHGSPAPDVPPSSVSEVKRNPAPPTFQDAQVRVVSLAMTLPNSSFFSNYEVFVAERWLGKTESQLIKLVYEFLPYQRRLSEYGNVSKVFKVRITRDPSCDESLMQIMWPQGEKAESGSQQGGGAVATNTSDRKMLLPCYRTTADEYRRASGKR